MDRGIALHEAQSLFLGCAVRGHLFAASLATVAACGAVAGGLGAVAAEDVLEGEFTLSRMWRWTGRF